MTIIYDKYDGTIVIDIWDNYDENLKVIRNLARQLKCNLFIFSFEELIYEYKEGDENKMEEVDYEMIRQRALATRGSNNYGIPFGYKVFWIALHTARTKSVIKDLDMKDVERVEWAEGLERAYDGEVFVTPPVDDWTFVVGTELPLPESDSTKDPVVKMINGLAKKYKKVHFMGSHRVSGTILWMTSNGGYLQRLMLMEDGEVKINYGERLKIEEKWDEIDEDNVLRMMDEWKVPNPMEIHIYDNVGKYGYVGKPRTYIVKSILRIIKNIFK